MAVMGESIWSIFWSTIWFDQRTIKIFCWYPIDQCMVPSWNCRINWDAAIVFFFCLKRTLNNYYRYAQVHHFWIRADALYITMTLSSIKRWWTWVKGDEMLSQEQIPWILQTKVSKSFEVDINRDYAYSMDWKQVLKNVSTRKPICPIRRWSMATWHLEEPIE